jgi:hypothetical protein
MKKVLSTITVLSLGTFAFGQVGINTPTPESTLDIRGKNHLGPVTANDGVLVPRVSDLITNGAVSGQLVYLVADSGAFTKGFYYWNGIVWTGFGGSITGSDTTNDAWINDSSNTMVKLGTLSDGSTARAAGTEFVAKDNGAVGIGTSLPDSSSILDITSADKGILIPRVSLTSATDQTTILAPAVGLLVYNTGASTLTYKGFVFWNGTEWRSINNTTTINPSISGLTCSGASAFPQTFTSGVPYSGTLTVPYSNGNGGSYQGASSFTQNGLTFTLNPGTLNNGNGTITYSVTGTPNFSSPSTATIPLSFLGFNCNAIIGNNSSSFAVGEVKSVRIVVPASEFTNRSTAGTINGMNGKLITNTSTISNRNQAYTLANATDKSRFIVINGLRMDFLQSRGSDNSVSPKFFNTLSNAVSYNVSSLSTNDAYTQGAGTNIQAGYYSYNIDGNDDFACGFGTQAEYVNAMITFDNGEWYNCTWHATRDANNYYFYMTAQRLN